ncbi:MAG: hypothetical protein ACUVRP_11680, partial [Chlorobiales bacterium]
MRKTSTKCLFKVPAAFLRLFVFFFVVATHSASAQHTTPTIDGSFDNSTVYPNSLSSDGRTWYVTWDNTNLYVFVQGAGVGNRVLMYFDTNPSIPVNGGTDGSVVGINYSNTHLTTLPFSAEAFVALETGYRQLNTCFTGTSFSLPIVVTGAPGWAFANVGGDFEAQIPWNAINNNSGRPGAFNWFGYITDNNNGGNYFSKVPTANPGGIIGTTLPNATNTAGYERYFKITNTGNTTSTSPFVLDCYTFVRFIGVDANPFGAITVEDFTMNTASRSIVRASDASNWTINGTLRINNGTVNFGSNTGSCTVKGNIVIGSNGTLTLSNNPNALTVNANMEVNGTLNPNSSSTVRFSGTGTQSVSGTTSPINFRNVIVSKPDSRIEDNVFPPPSTNYFNGLYFAQSTTILQDMRLDSGLVFFSPSTGSGTFNHTIQGNVRMGSLASSVYVTSSFAMRTNTALVVNNRANTTVNMTIKGNLEAGTLGTLGVTLILAGANAGTGSNVNVQVEGDFKFTSRPLNWACNTATTGVSSILMKFVNSTIQLGNTSTFNGNRPGTTNPTIRVEGTSTITIPPVVFLGLSGNTNAQADWEITGTATLTSGSAIAINRGRTLTINGTLICQDGAELISTQTGPSSGDPTLVMGASGILRVADVQGLGDGTLPNPTSNFPLLIRRGSSTVNWKLSSINTDGTIEYNGTGQTVTPRNGTNNYFNLTFSGSGNKTLGGDVDVSNTLNLNGGIVST